MLEQISLVFISKSQQQHIQNHSQKHNHKIDTIFILGNPQGEENPTKLPLYKMYKKHKTRPQIGAPPSNKYIFLSPMHYTQVSVYSNEEHISSIYTLFCHLTFNLTSRPHLTKWVDFTQEDPIQYYIIFIRVLMTRLTMEALPHDSMMTNYNSMTPMKE